MKRLALRPPLAPASAAPWQWLRVGGVWAAVGALLMVLAYQLPARHVVQIGSNDAAYVQGFSDPVNRWGVRDPTSQADTPLRWTTERSTIIFPQIGLPATATIRLRAAPSAAEPLPTVRVLLNGRAELASFRATRSWQTYSFPITQGWAKANDAFLELRVDPLTEIGGVARGVQVDQATFATVAWPIVPYPAQVVYGAAAIGLGALLLGRQRTRRWLALAITLAFVLLYRLPVPPYPLRALLPELALVFGALVVLRALPTLQTRLDAGRGRALLTIGAPIIVMALWGSWIALAARNHVALSIPGVERDFPVFATRATALVCPVQDRAGAPCVLRADGFYQLGYPFLLWLIKPVTGGNAFVAAQAVAIISALGVLAATFALGWRLFQFEGALPAIGVLLLSPFFVQYSLFVGTDMPFAALWVAALAALFAPQRIRSWNVLLAGVLAGGAFVIRHPGLVLLPLGWIVVWVARPQRSTMLDRSALRLLGWFTLGWLVAAAPQIAVNLIDTGQPLYSQQAKNIWLAVYGNIDYSRWGEAANDVALRDLVLADPARFFGNWARNLRAFLGTGAEDTSEFGQAISLRLLGFPANWLALIGLALWVGRGDWRRRLLASGAALYALGVSVGFVLPRFFLPLAPLWALASVTSVIALAHRLAQKRAELSRTQWVVLIILVLLLFLRGGPSIGVRAVLERQNAAAGPPVQTAQPRPAPGDRAPRVPFGPYAVFEQP